MKKWSRSSKKTTRKARRSKKFTRRALNRRRQRGGGDTVFNCTLNTSSGALTVTPAVTSSAPDNITVTSPGANTLLITSAKVPIKNVRFGNAPAAKVGGPGPGITLQDQADNKYIIPSSSHLYTKKLAAAQMKLDAATGKVFPSGLKVTNINQSNLGVTGSVISFTVTVTD